MSRLGVKFGNIVTLLACLVCVTPFQVLAISSADYDSAVNRSELYDPTTCSSAVSGSTTSSAIPGPIYIMGDSITKIAEPTYISKFQDWTPTTVEGLVSRQIQGGVSPDGLTELSNDQAKIAQAHAVVIALGTNGVTNPAATTKSEVQAAMAKIRQYNTQNAPVFWVNVLDTRHDTASQTTNQAISDGVGSDATVIDWYSEAKSKADLGSFAGGVHPTTQADINLLVNLVYTAVTGGGNGGAAATSEAGSCCPAGSTSLIGGDNQQKVWNFFKGKGLSDIQVAGIMGNLQQESGFSPTIVNPTSGAYGLGQWLGGRLTSLQALPNYQTLPVQLNYMWGELSGSYKPTVLDPLMKATDLQTATDIWLEKYEIPCSLGNCGGELATRLGFAQGFLRKYGGAGSITGGTSSSVGCGSGGSPDCTSATGDAKILCEAKRYTGIYYEWAGGHSGYNGPYSKFIKGCPDPANPPNNQPNGGPVNGDPGGNSGNPSPCGLDCSGLVTIAVNAAFNQASGFTKDVEWATGTIVSDTANWKAINVRSAQAGDVVEPNPDHVQIVDHYDAGSGTLSIFQSLGTGIKIGSATAPASDYSTAYHYIGPGSN